MESEKISQNQFYDIIISRKPDWQAIIYNLINTEQLDPWDIDIIILTKKYFEKINELGEADFYVSSKVILAASLLLRIKSEFLLNKQIKSIDDILFNKKEEDNNYIEKIEIDEEELPILIPRTPLPRLKKVTLHELIAALNKAISTESKRIKREVAVKRAKRLSELDFPSFNRVDLKERIRQFYARVLTAIKKKAINTQKDSNKIAYSDLVGKEREERLVSFLPLLHLGEARKIWLEQYQHLDEIWVYLHEYFKKNKSEFLDELEEDTVDIEQLSKELIKEQEVEEITGFEDEIE